MSSKRKTYAQALAAHSGKRIEGLAGLSIISQTANDLHREEREAADRSKRVAEGLSDNAGERTRRFD